jgi:hypothetical protein
VQGDQYGIDWLDLGSPDRIHRRLRSMYVSHAVWLDGHSEGFETLGGDIAFFEFMHRYTKNRRRIGAYNVAELPKAEPILPPGERLVAVYSCDVDYPNGIFRVSDLNTPRFGPNKALYPAPFEPRGDPEEWRKDVIAIAIDTFCPHTDVPKLIELDFERVARRGERWGRGHDLWLRRSEH